nr:PREDICTED: uncharacterized protein LOC109452454 [Rhinolophus sinicus]
MVTVKRNLGKHSKNIMYPGTDKGEQKPQAPNQNKTLELHSVSDWYLCREGAGRASCAPGLRGAASRPHAAVSPAPASARGWRRRGSRVLVPTRHLTADRLLSVCNRAPQTSQRAVLQHKDITPLRSLKTFPRLPLQLERNSPVCYNAYFEKAIGTLRSNLSVGGVTFARRVPHVRGAAARMRPSSRPVRSRTCHLSAPGVNRCAAGFRSPSSGHDGAAQSSGLRESAPPSELQGLVKVNSFA